MLLMYGGSKLAEVFVPFLVSGPWYVAGDQDDCGSTIKIAGYYLGFIPIATGWRPTQGQSFAPYKCTLNRFLFQGREWDPDVQLYDFRARFYSPRLGRFLSRDPEGYSDSLNLYCFVNNNPVCFRDPTGECIFCDAWDWVKEKWEKGTLQGVLRAVGGGLQIVAGMALCATGVGAPLGGLLIAHGIGDVIMGGYEAIASETSGYHRTMLGDAAMSMGVDKDVGGYVELGWDVAGIALDVASIINVARAAPKTVKTATEVVDKIDNVATVVKNTGKASTELARETGRAGEIAAGITKNTRHIDSLTKTAKFRVPDVLDKIRKVIGEVKYVKRLALTKQMRDYISFAQKEVYTFELTIRNTTKMSAPLKKALTACRAVMRYLP